MYKHIKYVYLMCTEGIASDEASTLQTKRIFIYIYVYLYIYMYIYMYIYTYEKLSCRLYFRSLSYHTPQVKDTDREIGRKKCSERG